jgi:hypothetical protein
VRVVFQGAAAKRGLAFAHRAVLAPRVRANRWVWAARARCPISGF